MKRCKWFLIYILMVCFTGCGNAPANQKDSGSASADNPTSEARQDATQPESESAQSAAQQGDSQNFALIVGINKYPNLPANKQLKGCVNDARMMENLMKEVFGFQPANIKMLLDEDATKANILGEFENFLIKNAQKNSQVMFYFSGHGSRTTDDNNDEQDGLDETLVTHDSRDPQGKVKDIRDDELEQLLTKLTAKCDNVSIILDCCSSGSGFRGEDTTPTTAIPRLAPEVGNAAVVENATGMEGRTGFLPPNLNYVLISACKDKEYAYEHNGQGAMTAAINEVMRQNPRTTYRAMMYDVYTKVNAAFSTQNPQIEGNRRDAKLFGDLGKVDPFVEVESDNNDEKLILKAGQAHGVTVGSIYSVYKPGTTSKDQQENYLGKVEITALRPFQAAAKVLERNGTIPKNAAAFETARQFGDMRMPVLFELNANASVKSKVEAALAEHKKREDLLNSVASGEVYHIRAFVSGESVIMERPDQFELKKIPVSAPDLVDKMMDLLTKEARRLNVIKLENKSSSLKIAFTTRRWEKVEEDAFGAPQIVNPLPLETTPEGLLEMDIGNIMQFTVTNNSSEPVHIYMLDLATDGGISLLFPGIGAQDSPLAPGDSILSSHMRVTPPSGINVYKIIATNQPTDFFSLTQSGYRSVTETSKSPLDKLLNMAWGGTRNLQVIKPTRVGDWTTEKLSFRIR